ncbi:MAG: GNAT family N-acetyltransferase, partial [Flavobacteriales bacterium]|nr:GNAT family N-acetyltransferase [Flavobacteriales bacterium]
MDEERLIETINHPEIAKTTLTIPHPYTTKDAQWWLNQCEQQNNCGEPQKNWALRNANGLLCGGIGLHFKYGINSHKDEIGYWLMRDLWGKGIMTKIVAKFSDYCFSERGLKRLEAPIFEINPVSGRVLEK